MSNELLAKIRMCKSKLEHLDEPDAKGNIITPRAEMFLIYQCMTVFNEIIFSSKDEEIQTKAHDAANRFVYKMTRFTPEGVKDGAVILGEMLDMVDGN